VWHLAVKYSQPAVLKALAAIMNTQSTLPRQQQLALEARTALTAQQREPLTPKQLQHFFANIQNSKGQTPLMLACAQGSLECMETLLALGADPWVVDKQLQNSCLHYAAQHGQAACILRLFDAPLPPRPAAAFATRSATGRCASSGGLQGLACKYATWRIILLSTHSVILPSTHLARSALPQHQQCPT
jgi:hypothetical protein